MLLCCLNTNCISAPENENFLDSGRLCVFIPSTEYGIKYLSTYLRNSRNVHTSRAVKSSF